MDAQSNPVIQVEMKRFQRSCDKHFLQQPLMQCYITIPDRSDGPIASLSSTDSLTMSLPGLQLSGPVEPVVRTAVHDLPEGSEWRFEVAFGSKVEVKVCLKHALLTWSANRNNLICSYSLETPSSSAQNLRRNRHTLSRVQKQPSLPGMAAVLKLQETVRSIT